MKNITIRWTMWLSVVAILVAACSEAYDSPETAQAASAVTVSDGHIGFADSEPLSQDAGIFGLAVPTEMHGAISFGDSVASQGALRFAQSHNAASQLITAKSLNPGGATTNVLTVLATPFDHGNPDAGYNETAELGDARMTNAILVATNVLSVMQPGGAAIWQWSHLGQVAALAALGTPGDVTAYWQFGGGALTGHAGELRWTGGGEHLMEIRPTIGDGETSLLVRRNVGGTYALERVSMGDADSCGTGYRCLRVAN